MTLKHTKKLIKTPLTNLQTYILIVWKKKGFIIDNTYNTIYCSGSGNLPRAYGLPKIHKSGFTFRIIISSVDSPTYSIANFIHRIISRNIVKPHSPIENSYN